MAPAAADRIVEIITLLGTRIMEHDAHRSARDQQPDFQSSSFRKFNGSQLEKRGTLWFGCPVAHWWFHFFFFERFRSSYFVNVSLFSFPSVRSRPLISPISRRSMHDTSRPERSRTLRREMKKKEPNKNDVERKHVFRLVEQRTTSTRKYPVSSRETVAINFNGWKSDNDPKQCHYKPRKPFLTASKLR